MFNRSYNPDGPLDPETFKFPYRDRSFDLVFLTSVFTHMLPPEVAHYLAETRRVLRRGGRCFATFFVLNPVSLASAKATGSKRLFLNRGDGYSYNSPSNPEASLGYREREVRRLLNQAELRLQVLRYGRWSGRPDAGVTGQDIVVARRPGLLRRR